MAIVTSLTVAGARPAAAMDLGLMHQISNLWSFITGGPSQAPHRATHRSTTMNKTTTTTTDRGFGIDPNGTWITTDPSTTTSTGG